MAALAPLQRTIRVYCPVHKVGFSAAASAIIGCSTQKHTLATTFPNDGFWEYCCDCQHYWPIDSAKGNTGSDECPACERQIVKRFVCGNCQVVTIESDSPGRRKELLISVIGAPTPSCPGCMRRPTGNIVEHECADFDCAFTTTRVVCPFCDDPLEPLPSFPCSVATYKNSLRGSQVTLEFDPVSNLLTESTKGSYLLIKRTVGSSSPFVIPKSATLTSKQDYYNSYYELFNCDNPASGEVFILAAAVVEESEKGWLLREPGFIEIRVDQVTVTFPTIAPVNEVCGKCGTLCSPKHGFCRRCGTPLYAPQTGSCEIDTNKPPTAAHPELSPRVSDNSFVTSTPVIPALSGMKPLFIGLGALAVIVIAVILLAVPSGTASVEQKLDQAITSGNLFSGTDNAHDLYLQLKNSGASDDKLRLYRNRILPQLTNRPMQMVTDFMVPGSDDPALPDWMTVAQSLKWAAELNPNDTTFLSRALYAEGRVAYLSKDEELAISIWTRAADADQTWPLPVNGIGLIHTGRKNYPTARSYYQSAIQRNPNWAYPYNNMGTTFYMQKDFYDAKGYYQKAAELAPHWARPHSWLGDIALKEQDYNKAVSEFSFALDPNATGTKNMDLEKIRRQLELAQQRANQF